METFLINARIGLAMYEKKAFPKKDSEGETGLQQSEKKKNKKSVCMYKLCFNQAETQVLLYFSSCLLPPTLAQG